APVLASTGRKLLAPASNADGIAIPAALPYVGPRPGDVEAVVASGPGGAVTSANSFAQWFADVPGVNQTAPGNITMTRNASNDTYIFEGSLDAPGGGSGTNAAYTYEISTTFIHEAGQDWFLDVDTAADVWVYIDGKLVMDSGAGAGFIGLQDFEIGEGTVKPGQPFAAAISVLGVAFSSGKTPLP